LGAKKPSCWRSRISAAPDPSSPEPDDAGGPAAAPQGGGRNLTLAILTGLGLVGLILLTLFTSKVAFFLLVVAAVLMAQWELYRALGSRGLRAAELFGVAAGFLVLLGALVGGPGAVAFALTMCVIAVMLWYLADPERSQATPGMAVTLFGLVYVPFSGAHVILMRNLEHGPALTIAYIGLVALYDIGAFTSGSLFGRRPMAPSISPKKTWEGLAGATLFVALIAAVAGPHIGPFRLGTALAMAAVAAVGAPLGDLAESLMKRDLEIKDMGSILPGHGGFLDRIDALLFVAPPAYWLARMIVA